jgi:hypothetical protein
MANEVFIPILRLLSFLDRVPGVPITGTRDVGAELFKDRTVEGCRPAAAPTHEGPSAEDLIPTRFHWSTARSPGAGSFSWHIRAA